MVSLHSNWKSRVSPDRGHWPHRRDPIKPRPAGLPAKLPAKLPANSIIVSAQVTRISPWPGGALTVFLLPFEGEILRKGRPMGEITVDKQPGARYRDGQIVQVQISCQPIGRDREFVSARLV